MPSTPILLFATHNQGKVKELIALSQALQGLEVKSLQGLNIPKVKEDGNTFAENAAKKATEVSKATGLPALADDSGLQVDALDLAPGIYSARYASPQATDLENNEKLLKEMKHQPLRTARFRSALAFADTEGQLGEQVIIFEGVCEGEILQAQQGISGFGYDPLFYSHELQSTFAEATLDEKNLISHRAKAMILMIPKLIEYFHLINYQ